MIVDDTIVDSGSSAAWRPRVVPSPPTPRGPRLPDDLPERWDEEEDDGTED